MVEILQGMLKFPVGKITRFMPFDRNTMENHRRATMARAVVVALFLLLARAPAGAAQAALPPGKTAAPQAQSPATAQPPATPAVAVNPEPVPLNDVAKRLEISRRLLREVSERPEASEVPEIAKELEATRSAFADEVAKTGIAITGNPRSEALSDLEISWKNRGARISKWQQAIYNWSSQLYNDYMLVDQEQKTWALTLNAYPARSFPREVERAIRDLLAEAEKIKAGARKRLDAALVLQNELYQRGTSVSGILGNIAQARDRFRGSLIVAEQAPLWEVMGELERMQLPPGALRALLSRQLLDTLEFARGHLRGLILAVFAFIVALLVAFLLSRKVAHWTQDHPHFKEATHFLRRPASLALLITLVPGLLFFSESAPRLMLSVGALLLLIPLLRLLPPLMHPTARPILYAVAAFYVFNSLRNLFLTDPLLNRLSFVVAGIVAIIILVWFSRRARVKKASAEGLAPTYVILAFRVALFLISVSLVANIFGYFDLASLLSQATLYSLYAAFALFASAGAMAVVFAVFLDTDTARSLSVVRRYGKTISQQGRRIFFLAAFALWVNAFLSFFTVKSIVVDAVTSFFTAPIKQGRVNFSLWDVIAFGLVLAAAVLVARAMRLVLQEDVFPRLRVARGVPEMITTTVYYTLLLLGFFLALGIAGVDLNRFTLLAGAFGVGVGFGLQNMVNNFISGLILLFERPIHQGDTIEVGGVQGVVNRIGIRSSMITTSDGAEAIIPNATLISEKLMNWTLSDPWRRVDIKLGVAYGSDLQKVMQILLSVTTSDPDVLRDPAPAVLFQGFGENSLGFELRFWSNIQTHLDTKTRVSLAIAKALREAGIEIPVPQRDLRLRSIDEHAEGLLTRGDPEAPKTK